MESCSPQSWGLTEMQQELAQGLEVFPAVVGINRRLTSPRLNLLTCSPQSWGLTYCAKRWIYAGVVFPAVVGINRTVAL